MPMKAIIHVHMKTAIDSSRCFALRLQDGSGRFATVGLGFAERDDAFDFIYSLNDFHNR